MGDGAGKSIARKPRWLMSGSKSSLKTRTLCQGMQSRWYVTNPPPFPIMYRPKQTLQEMTTVAFGRDKRQSCFNSNTNHHSRLESSVRQCDPADTYLTTSSTPSSCLLDVFCLALYCHLSRRIGSHQRHQGDVKCAKQPLSNHRHSQIHVDLTSTPESSHEGNPLMTQDSNPLSDNVIKFEPNQTKGPEHPSASHKHSEM